MTADHDLVSIVWMAVIVISYSLAVCLDYLSQVKQLKVFKQSGEIGKSFVVRGKIALISRGCAFLLAPMLGILLARGVSSGDLLMLFWFNLVSRALCSCHVYADHFIFSQMQKSPYLETFEH